MYRTPEDYIEPKPNPITRRWSKADVYPIKDYSITSSPSKIFEDHAKNELASVKSRMQSLKMEIDSGEFKPKPIRTAAKIRAASSYRALEDGNLFAPIPVSMRRMDGEYWNNRPQVAYTPGVERKTWLMEEPPHNFGYRQTYSRYTAGDPDYFDFDLESSIDRYKTFKDKYRATRSPLYHEHQLLSDLKHGRGERAIAPHIFTQDSKNYPDWRYAHTGVMSAALQTPSVWQYRFEKLLEK